MKHRRQVVNKAQSARQFRREARYTHKANVVGPSLLRRGGIRL